MIISASRRTDIPSYYSEWFYNRIREGFVLVRNPMNFHQVSRIDLSPELVDGIVFWTKNPAPMLKRLKELEAYAYYVQFTLTPYGTDVEPKLPSKREVLIPGFVELSDRIGAERVIWRYDPVLLSQTYPLERHIRDFEELAMLLKGYTKKCIISFLDMYKNTRRNREKLGFAPITAADMVRLAEAFSGTAKRCGMELCTCSETIELGAYGISHGSCIDRELFERLTGVGFRVDRDPNQRKACGCASSIDIGAYNSCKNLCGYCYANYSVGMVERNHRLHNPESPLLFGELGEEDRVTERKMVSLRDGQQEFQLKRMPS